METYLGSTFFCNSTSDEQHGCEIILEKEKEQKRGNQAILDKLELI